jgi:hypothetical protein
MVKIYLTVVLLAIFAFSLLLWLTQIRQLGVDVLMNEHRTITIGNSSILIGGVTDYEAGYALPEHASSPSKALSGLRSVNFKMLLAHQPEKHLPGC